jgi:hypothetical protein
LYVLKPSSAFYLSTGKLPRAQKESSKFVLVVAVSILLYWSNEISKQQFFEVRRHFKIYSKTIVQEIQAVPNTGETDQW